MQRFHIGKATVNMMQQEKYMKHKTARAAGSAARAVGNESVSADRKWYSQDISIYSGTIPITIPMSSMHTLTIQYTGMLNFM